MKTRVATVFVMAASLLLSAIAVRAAENCPVSFGEFDNLVRSNTKNECLVVAKNCAAGTDTVQQRVDELRREIAKGSYVYTPGELRVLKEQLKWIEFDNDNQFI